MEHSYRPRPRNWETQQHNFKVILSALPLLARYFSYNSQENCSLQTLLFSSICLESTRTICPFNVPQTSVPLQRTTVTDAYTDHTLSFPQSSAWNMSTTVILPWWTHLLISNTVVFPGFFRTTSPYLPLAGVFFSLTDNLPVQCWMEFGGLFTTEVTRDCSNNGT